MILVTLNNSSLIYEWMCLQYGLFLCKLSPFPLLISLLSLFFWCQIMTILLGLCGFCFGLFFVWCCIRFCFFGDVSRAALLLWNFLFGWLWILSWIIQLFSFLLRGFSLLLCLVFLWLFFSPFGLIEFAFFSNIRRLLLVLRKTLGVLLGQGISSSVFSLCSAWCSSDVSACTSTCFTLPSCFWSSSTLLTLLSFSSGFCSDSSSFAFGFLPLPLPFPPFPRPLPRPRPLPFVFFSPATFCIFCFFSIGTVRVLQLGCSFLGHLPQCQLSLTRWFVTLYCCFFWVENLVKFMAYFSRVWSWYIHVALWLDTTLQISFGLTLFFSFLSGNATKLVANKSNYGNSISYLQTFRDACTMWTWIPPFWFPGQFPLLAGPLGSLLTFGPSNLVGCLATSPPKVCDPACCSCCFWIPDGSNKTLSHTHAIGVDDILH